MKKITFNLINLPSLILIIGIVSTFSSCNGQNNFQDSKLSKKTIELGRPIAKLDSTIWNIYQDKKSNFWFGSKENGVFYYDGQRLKHITKEDGLVSNQILGIQEITLLI